MREAERAGHPVAGCFDTDPFADNLSSAACREAWRGFAERAPAPWLLALAPGEHAPAALWREIGALPETSVPPACYRASVSMAFLGRTIRGGAYGSRTEVRLVHREHAAPTVRGVELGPVRGGVRDLACGLRFQPFANLEDGLASIDRATSVDAMEIAARGRRAHAADFLFRPPLVLMRELIARGGIRDGLPGFVLATLVAARELILHAKLWEQGLPESVRQTPSSPDRR